MKEQVDVRDAETCQQYQFDSAEFSPINLEDSIVTLINEVFEGDIRAVSSLDFHEDTDTVEPIIVVASAGLQAPEDKRALALAEFGEGTFPGSHTNAKTFEQLMIGTMAVNCVARTARGTTNSVYELMCFFQELQYYMAELLPILSFKPLALESPKKVEDNEHLWKSTIQCKYVVGRSWSTERIAPRLKTFSRKGLE